MHGREQRTEILVVGGGFGGVAAALAAARCGRDVIVTEPTRWLGGVATSQAVPFDEHLWIEQFGCTASYRALRDGIRRYYRQHYPLTEAARANPVFNPGGALVSDLCVEPRVTLAALKALLAPHVTSGRVRVLSRHAPVAADVDGDRVRAVTFQDLVGGGEVAVSADWVIDATELGDLLPLTGTEYVTGSESREETGEPSAPTEADPLNMQAVSVCFALDHRDGEDHVIDRPASYARFRDARPPGWPQGQLSFHVASIFCDDTPRDLPFQPNPNGDPDLVRTDYAGENGGAIDENLWTYRRILARRNFAPGAFASDVTLVNWPQIDYVDGPLFEVPEDEARAHAQAARELSLSFLHWLQTEAPRPDGGTGWPGLRLRGDVVGDTPDGLAMFPYVRESRRIRAEHTVVEQEVALAVRGAHGAVRHADSVGIGMYNLDLHPTTGGDGQVEAGCCPFELPLGALIPVRMENLLAGAKNIGTTHITSSAYRIAYIEWNAGEAAGHVAALCAERGVTPRAVRAQPRLLEELQRRLVASGVELRWPHIRGY